MAYDWDIFLSYPREKDVGSWVINHFAPVLNGCLTAVLPQRPKIFIDQAQPTGVNWPEHIKAALLSSRMMVAIWTPPFFQSDWCMSEWSSMLQREALLASENAKPARGLIYPVVYSDGKHFDPGAKDTQYRKDLSNLTYPFPCFRESPLYLQFYDAVRSIAEEIEEHLAIIPDWRPDWPLVEPPPSPDAPLSLPRL